MTLRDMLIEAMQQAEEQREFKPGEEIPNDWLRHSHFGSMRVFQTNSPMPCGSQYFVRINSQYTIGFDDLTELAEFRNTVIEGVGSMIEKAAAKPEAAKECLVCGKEVSLTDGFEMTIGWMHEECNKENVA